jgi:hypothetical protein
MMMMMMMMMMLEIRAYDKAMFEAKVSDPRACYFVDDTSHNVETARVI